ncbi:MAG: HAMP domain-containing histidine kinase [Lachnospiraceae bacterium]|nr:HAMP domain-containing histidine kinase [Lachnospiraceae bacterium]
MTKYYRRLTWGLIILMSLIALGAMVLMTKSRAEDIMEAFRSDASDAVHRERSEFSLHQSSHPTISEEDTLDPEFWDVFVIEKAYAAMAKDYGVSYAKSFGMSSETGYYSDLFVDGEKAPLSKSFLVLYDPYWYTEQNLNWEPLYAPIPEEFWELPEVKAGSNGDTYIEDAYRYSHMLDDAVRITGLRYQGMVYIETLELYDAYWLYDQDEGNYIEKYFTFDLSPYLHDVPSGAEPYQFCTSWFGTPGEGTYTNPCHQDFVDLAYHEEKENSDSGYEWKLRQEAAELVESTKQVKWETIDDFESSRFELGTSYVIEMADRGPWSDDTPTYYAIAFVTHPLRLAIRGMTGAYMAIGFVLLVSIIVLACLVYSLRTNQERYEWNRLAMTRIVAHELKTPLAVTKNYVENWEDIPEESRAQYREKMVAQIDYVSGLVGDLLDLSRMEAKAKEPFPEPVNLPELNEVILRQLASVIGDREITVNTAEDRESLTVQADLAMMRTVLVNLVTNAIRYGEKTIAIDISKNRDTVRYQITNDGEPIPEDQLALIWDTFYRVDGSRNGRGRSRRAENAAGKGGLAKDGSGLGLAITRQILELHGARYGCTSDAMGTTVYFEL